MVKFAQPIQPTLFHTKFWSSSRPAAVLMELGLTKEMGGPIEIATITEKELKSDPWLLQNNPQKRLPFFYDPTNDIKLNESGGMVQYLLETYDPTNKLWPAPDSNNPKRRAEFLKLLHFGPATAYHVGVPIFFHFMVPRDDPLWTCTKDYESKKKEWHTFVAPTLEQALERFGGPYLLGDQFSAADIVCGYDLMTLSFTKCAKELLDPHPKVKAYLDTISQREVYKKLYSMEEDQSAEKEAEKEKEKTHESVEEAGTQEEHKSNADNADSSTTTTTTTTTTETQITQIVPIFRSFDETKAKEFYVDYLGFRVAFEHRFDENAPLYFGIRLSDSGGGGTGNSSSSSSSPEMVLHLSEHHGDCTPGSTLRISVKDLVAFQAGLASKTTPYKNARPQIQNQPWGYREMTLTDPFGNKLIFYDDKITTDDQSAATPVNK